MKRPDEGIGPYIIIYFLRFYDDVMQVLFLQNVIPAKAGIQKYVVIPAEAGIQKYVVIPAEAGIQKYVCHSRECGNPEI